MEIASSDDTTSRIWYPGNVVGLHLCDGVEKVAVECFTLRVQETVIADQIRPTPPPNGESKGFEMMDNVEVFYNKGWGSGQVKMILGVNTYSVYLNSSMETILFKPGQMECGRWQLR